MTNAIRSGLSIDVLPREKLPAHHVLVRNLLRRLFFKEGDRESREEGN
jgi:hypothetical protein